MTDINGVHKWINLLSNKAVGTYFAPAEIDEALHRAQMQVFMTYYAQSFLAEKVIDALSPFKAYPNYQFLTSDTPAGVLTLPAGYEYLTGGHVIVSNNGHTEYNKIEIYSEDEISQRQKDQIKPLTSANPVAMIAGRVNNITTLQFYPKTAVAGELFYLTAPIPPVFGYTQTGRVITYSSGTSTQLQWNEAELNQIMLAALEFLGVSSDDQQLSQYSNQKSNEVT